MTDFSLVGPPASPIRSTQHPIQWFSIIQRKLALTAPESNLFHTRAVIILQNAVASLDRKRIGSIWRYFFPVDGSAQDQTRPKPGVMRAAQTAPCTSRSSSSPTWRSVGRIRRRHRPTSRGSAIHAAGGGRLRRVRLSRDGSHQESRVARSRHTLMQTRYVDIVQSPVFDRTPYPCYLGVDSRTGRLLPLEQQSHEVQGDSDLKGTCPARQLEEFVAGFGQPVGGVGNRWLFVFHFMTIDFFCRARDWRRAHFFVGNCLQKFRAFARVGTRTVSGARSSGARQRRVTPRRPHGRRGNAQEAPPACQSRPRHCHYGRRSSSPFPRCRGAPTDSAW